MYKFNKGILILQEQLKIAFFEIQSTSVQNILIYDGNFIQFLQLACDVNNIRTIFIRKKLCTTLFIISLNSAKV